MSTGGSGQLFAVSHRNSGAFSHRDFDTSSQAFKPLEPSSAGFARVGTYFHWLGRDAASILESRFATKVGKHLEAGLELGECQGGPLPPKNFAWPPQNFPRDVMLLH